MGPQEQFDKIFGTRSPEEQIEAETAALMFSFLAIFDRVMEERRITKKALAAQIGTSPAYVTQLFRGHKTINLEMIVKMKQALGIEFSIRLKK